MFLGFNLTVITEYLVIHDTLRVQENRLQN